VRKFSVASDLHVPEQRLSDLRWQLPAANQLRQVRGLGYGQVFKEGVDGGSSGTLRPPGLQLIKSRNYSGTGAILFGKINDIPPLQRIAWNRDIVISRTADAGIELCRRQGE
jgi:hypothetical protein